jgi:hypothetical protein
MRSQSKRIGSADNFRVNGLQNPYHIVTLPLHATRSGPFQNDPGGDGGGGGGSTTCAIQCSDGSWSGTPCPPARF